MAYYNTCPICGANLDSGEPCDCMTERKKQNEESDLSGEAIQPYSKWEV